RGCCRRIGSRLAREQVGHAGLLGARLPRQSQREWMRLARDQTVQCGFDVGNGGELMETPGAIADFAGGLWTAQHQKTKRRGFRPVEIKTLLKLLTEFQRAAVSAGKDESEFLLAQTIQRASHG